MNEKPVPPEGEERDERPENREKGRHAVAIPDSVNVFSHIHGYAIPAASTGGTVAEPRLASRARASDAPPEWIVSPPLRTIHRSCTNHLTAAHPPRRCR